MKRIIILLIIGLAFGQSPVLTAPEQVETYNWSASILARRSGVQFRECDSGDDAVLGYGAYFCWEYLEKEKTFK